MTKNIRVTDENGKLIGYTYPKRVKGLVKNDLDIDFSGAVI